MTPLAPALLLALALMAESASASAAPPELSWGAVLGTLGLLALLLKIALDARKLLFRSRNAECDVTRGEFESAAAGMATQAELGEVKVSLETLDKYTHTQAHRVNDKLHEVTLRLTVLEHTDVERATELAGLREQMTEAMKILLRLDGRVEAVMGGGRGRGGDRGGDRGGPEKRDGESGNQAT